MIAFNADRGLNPRRSNNAHSFVYTKTTRREKAIASGQGSSLKLAAAVKLLADYLFLTNEKASAVEYYKEALARVEARTEHDRAKPQTQSFSAQVRWWLLLVLFLRVLALLAAYMQRTMKRCSRGE